MPYSDSANSPPYDMQSSCCDALDGSSPHRIQKQPLPSHDTPYVGEQHKANSEVQSKIKWYSQEVQELRSLISSMESSLQRCELEKREYRKELSKRIDECRELEQHMQHQAQFYETKLDAAQSKVHEYQTSMSKKVREADKANELASSSQMELDKSQIKLLELQNMVQEKNQEISMKDSLIIQLRADSEDRVMAEREKGNMELDACRTASIRDLEALSLSNEADKVAAAEEIREKFENELQKIKSSCDEEILIQSKRITEMEQQKNDMKVVLEDIDKMGFEIQKLQTELLERSAKVVELESTLSDSKLTNDHIRNQASNLSEELAKQTEQVQQLDQQCGVYNKYMQEQCELLKDLNCSFMEKVVDSSTHIQSEKLVCHQLKSVFASMRNRILNDTTVMEYIHCASNSLRDDYKRIVSALNNAATAVVSPGNATSLDRIIQDTESLMEDQRVPQVNLAIIQGLFDFCNVILADIVCFQDVFDDKLAQITILEAEVTNLERKLNSYNLEHLERVVDCESQDHLRATLLSSVHELEEKLNSVSSAHKLEIEVKDAKIGQLSEALAQVNTRLATREAELDEIISCKADEADHMNYLNQTIAIERNRVEKLTADKELFIKERIELVDGYEDQITTLKQQYANSKSAIEREHLKDKKALNDVISEQQSEIARLDEELSSCRVELITATECTKKLETEVSTLKEELSSELLSPDEYTIHRSLDKSSLLDALDESIRQYNELCIKSESVSKLYSKLEEKLAVTEGKMSKLSQKNLSLTEELQLLVDQLTSTKAELVSTRGELKSVKLANSGFHEEKIEYEARDAKHSYMVKSLKDNVSAKEHIITALQEEIVVMKEIVQVQQQMLQCIKEDERAILRLGHEYEDSWRQQLDVTLESMATHESDLSDLRHRYGHLWHKHEALKEVFVSLRTHVEITESQQAEQLRTITLEMQALRKTSGCLREPLVDVSSLKSTHLGTDYGERIAELEKRVHRLNATSLEAQKKSRETLRRAVTNNKILSGREHSNSKRGENGTNANFTPDAHECDTNEFGESGDDTNMAVTQANIACCDKQFEHAQGQSGQLAMRGQSGQLAMRCISLQTDEMHPTGTTQNFQVVASSVNRLDKVAAEDDVEKGSPFSDWKITSRELQVVSPSLLAKGDVNCLVDCEENNESERSACVDNSSTYFYKADESLPSGDMSEHDDLILSKFATHYVVAKVPQLEMQDLVNLQDEVGSSRLEQSPTTIRSITMHNCVNENSPVDDMRVHSEVCLRKGRQKSIKNDNTKDVNIKRPRTAF